MEAGRLACRYHYTLLCASAAARRNGGPPLLTYQLLMTNPAMEDYGAVGLQGQHVRLLPGLRRVVHLANGS